MNFQQSTTASAVRETRPEDSNDRTAQRAKAASVLVRRPMDSFSKEVILEWVRVRGFSYFDEELEGIEQRMKKACSSAQIVRDATTAEVQQSAPGCTRLPGYHPTDGRVA